MTPSGVARDEFDLIERLFAPLAAHYPGALNLRDDAALLGGPGDVTWVVTMDTIVAGVHFLADDPPALIARKLIRVNLSDLAAKGAVPEAIMLAASFPRSVDLPWLDAFAAGLREDCQSFQLALIGGDTVATPGPLTLTLTAFGKTPIGAAILRSNARSGDDIWVSGTIGDAVLGLEVAKHASGTKAGLQGLAPPDQAWLLDRYRLPQPRVTLGRALVGAVHACMDVSDGLVADLTHLCRASSVAGIVEAERVPLSAAARRALTGAYTGGLVGLITGGDDYEILFTASPAAADVISRRADEVGERVTRIGHIVDGSGVSVIDGAGRTIAMKDAGYRHFAGDAR